MLYSDDVLTKPKILILNKMDCAGADDAYRIFREKTDGLPLQGTT